MDVRLPTDVHRERMFIRLRTFIGLRTCADCGGAGGPHGARRSRMYDTAVRVVHPVDWPACLCVAPDAGSDDRAQTRAYTSRVVLAARPAGSNGSNETNETNGRRHCEDCSIVR
ncbi:hypothetical protein GCM10010124_25060 [Pilimelia terevasa]|uniref:Uncharacterized protein n=1 Tax=Pilimelia terevasa TaxID=53372 RepID=A0A8J3FIW3_9ACTN|nr:hypothetical protein GCM10010124_25060 [Pilimelia terevasa]